jgi:hypothetical protein
MPKAPRPLSYFVTLVVTAVVAGPIFYLFDWGHSIMGCRQYKDPGTFLAYCAAPRFSYYEHGAFYLGLEPAAISRMKQADVLFLGNSHAQFGFSTDAVVQFFAVRSIRFYILAFSFAESAEFPRALIEKYNLRPKVLVIVTDPFFYEGAISPPAAELRDSEASLWLRLKVNAAYEQKKWFRSGQRLVCDHFPRACAENISSLYRSYANGTIVWRDISYPPNSAVPFSNPSTGQAINPDLADKNRTFAANFLTGAGIQPSCAVFTATPNNQIDAEAFTRRLAALLGANVIIPQLSGLAGVDPSHLNWPSAQRWSTAFLSEFDRVLSRCRG